MRVLKSPKGTSWVFNIFHDKFSCIQIQLLRSSGPVTKKLIFFIFFIIMGKLHIQWQYDPQKTKLRHKPQICAKSRKWKSNSFSTVPRKWDRDAQPPAPLIARPAARPARLADNFFPHLLQYLMAILAEGKKYILIILHGLTSKFSIMVQCDKQKFYFLNFSKFSHPMILIFSSIRSWEHILQDCVNRICGHFFKSWISFKEAVFASLKQD